MAPDAHSNIRVFIHWDDQTVFAGEEVKCRISFKNVAPSTSSHSRNTTPTTPARQSKQPNGLTPPVTSSRGHRSTLSLTVPATSAAAAAPPPGGTRSRSGTQQWVPPPQTPRRPGHAHKRSLSIVSIGSNATAEDMLPSASASPARPPRPPRGHGRSASLQISPRGGGGSFGSPHSASFPRRAFGSASGNESSPVFNNHSFPPPSRSRYGRASGSSSTAPNTPNVGGPQPRRGAPGPMPDFKFPMAPSPNSDSTALPVRTPTGDSYISPVSPLADPVQLPVRPKDSIPIITENSAPAPPAAARILAATSIGGGTPRSSGEFYSLSNNSSETLASEYVTTNNTLQNGRRPAHMRRSSGLMAIHQAKMPEALMMGYAQVQGSFMLDGSLINLGPFEVVKRKAVVGGQGGGVIGLDNNRRSSGLLSGFGWSSIGNSLGELLGGGELSSIKEMRGVASSKSIPLLSTPQSILFVDLQLSPGESKTYEYTFKLPKGLPPTHKGKAMKISYSLVIGTQRPGGNREQQVRSVEVPFRVLGGVNSYGEILGHDLLSPYIILRDMAKVQSLDKSAPRLAPPKKHKPAQSTSSINEFLNYVNDLLERRQAGAGLLSPTMTGPSSRRQSTYEESVAQNAKEAIDLAILRSNLSDGGQSSNRFEIARNGQRVGVVMLARPAYRLGEAVSLAIDFSEADIPCYAVHAVLETAERVDSSLALRSDSSIHRVTRRIHGSMSEATLFARRTVFCPTIPIGGTPEFVTSGVSLDWKIRIEFVVPSAASAPASFRRGNGGSSGSGSRDALGINSGGPNDDDEGSSDGGMNGSSVSRDPHPLLEEISRDDRGGRVLVAAEQLDCESFEVAVPLRVYGAVGNGLERLERDEAMEEGLAV